MAPVYGVEELVGDAHFAARGAFVEAEHPAQGRFRQVGAVLAGAMRPNAPVALRGAGHTDTETLLRGAGYTTEELTAMRSEGVIA